MVAGQAGGLEVGLAMSALGQKRTSGHVQSMSVLPPKADINGRISGPLRQRLPALHVRVRAFTLGVRGLTHHIFRQTPLGVTAALIETWNMDDVKSGQRINCNGVHGTVIGKRSTRNQYFVLAKMDNGFTLKLKADTLLAELPETAASAQLIDPAKQLASVD
jgi:hypothetical protein